MSKLILLRHGQSLWNLANLFTGWVDVPLSSKGIEESLSAGDIIKDISIDIIFVSALIRAQMSAMLAMSRSSSKKTPVFIHESNEETEWAKLYGEIIPVIESAALNERMYGELQGLNKAETIKKYGEEQVKIWRRSFDVPPLKGESLKMTAERSIPYFKEQIFPHLKEGKNVFIAAHGNSLRSIIMYLENLSKEEILERELETGIPLLYEYESDQFIKKSL